MAVNLLAGMQYVQQQGELGRQRGTQTRLNRLAGQAMSSPDMQSRDQLVQQAVAADREQGFALQDRLQSQDEARGLKARNAAKFVLDAWNSGGGQNAAAADRAYQEVIPFLADEGRRYGKPPPPNFELDMVPNMQAIVAMNGGANSNPYAGLPSDIQSLRYLQDNPQLAALDRERRQAGGMVPKLVQTAQGYGWGTPGAGIQLAPMDGVAGQQGSPQGAVAPGLYQTPQGVVRIGDDLSPQERAVAMADINAGGQASEVTLPPQQGAGGIAQPYRAPSNEQESFGQPQAVLGPDGQQRFVQFGNRGGVREVPGYNAAPNATANAADQKAVRQAQQKLPQLQNAIRGMDRIGDALRSLSGGMVNTGPMDQYYTRYTKEGQELEAAVGAIQNSVLALTRVPGVGSQSDLEQRVAMLQYPSLDKDPAVNARTLENLRLFMADLKAAYDNVTGGALPQSPQRQGGGRYSVGQVINVGGRRYRVTGGDPNDPDLEEVR